MKTAKALGIEVPRTLLARADEVIAQQAAATASGHKRLWRSFDRHVGSTSES